MYSRFAWLLALAACGGHETGSEGPEGPAGPAGPAGPQGPPGQVTVLDGGVIQGPPGPEGPAGPAGPAGDTGPAGAQGAAGPMGSMGATGAAGAAGAAGSTGPAGPAGPQGVAGSQGPGGGVFGEAAAEFAGFTATPISGVAGGRDKMYAACAAAFAGSHLCHIGEYHLANSATVPPAAGAWIDETGGPDVDGNETVLNELASVELGRFVGTNDFGNCDNWTSAMSVSNPTDGLLIGPAGESTALCTTTHVLACCTTPFAEKFRGFTTATTTGVAGGRAKMHAMCGAQFAGSHLCFSAEFYRSQTAVTPPVGGAWIDESGFVRNSFQVTNDIAGRDIARFTGTNDFGNCDNWTSAMSVSNPTSGALVVPAGQSTAVCTTSHPLACCQ